MKLIQKEKIGEITIHLEIEQKGLDRILTVIIKDQIILQIMGDQLGPNIVHFAAGLITMRVMGVTR